MLGRKSASPGSISATWAGNVVLGDTAGARIGGGVSGTLTVSGVISEAAAGSGVLFSRAAGSVTLLSNVNTYTGDTVMFAGSGTTTLKMGIANAINSGSRLITSTSTLLTNYFDLNGYNQNIRALADTVTGDLVVTNSSLTTDAELKLTTTDAQSFNGRIEDGLTRKTALVIAGSGSENFGGVNTYTGGTFIQSGSLILTGGDDRLATSGTVALGDVATSGKLVLGSDSVARNQTLAGLTSTGLGGNVVGAHATNNSVLTLNIASGTNTYSGVLGGGGTNENKLALTKSGSGILALTGSANTYSGPTTINAGGTLSLGAAGALSSASTVVLNGGTLLAGGFSNTGASLSLSAATGSAIDLSGTSVLAFSGIDALSFTSNTLAVWNWSGTLGGGGTERLMVPDGALTVTQLGNISFYSDGGTPSGLLGTAAYSLTNPGELVPVPEPGALATAAVLAAAAFGPRRRRR